MNAASRIRDCEFRRGIQKGYVLLTLLLFMALLMIAAAAVAPKLAFQIKRDREEELIHRGVQYSRAIRSFAKKTGRYPVSLDELQDTGGIRFIRKLYKDPITGGDFRLLHQGDVILLTAVPTAGVTSVQPDNGRTWNGTSSTDPTDSNAAKADSGRAETNPIVPFNNDGNNNQVGQVIFGVASKSKLRTIREFDRKNRYSEWLFFYDATRDPGVEIKGPTSVSRIPNQEAGSLVKQ